MSTPIIAIDAMGGDFGPHCVVPASIAFLAENPSFQLILVGLPDLLEEILSRSPVVDRRLVRVHAAGGVIGPDERPSQVLRGKPDTSMRVVLELVRDGYAHACVSAGNTGALMALSRYLLKTLPGIDRPAMVTAVPTQKGYCHLLDLGANVDCSAEHLYQFAVMGAVAAEVLGCRHPRVALLNVGTEKIKGNQQVKLAANLLQEASGLNFVGYIEGDGLYRGEADVVVCDGFVGNILLKASEGLAAMVSTRIEQCFKESLKARLVGGLALPLLRRFRNDIAPTHYNGASFLGLQGIVIKSHSGARPDGFRSALCRAALEVCESLPQRLHGRFEHLLR